MAGFFACHRSNGADEEFSRMYISSASSLHVDPSVCRHENYGTISTVRLWAILAFVEE